MSKKSFDVTTVTPDLPDVVLIFKPSLTLNPPIVDVVPTAEERWRHYPEKIWENEAPKNPRIFIGKDTRFKSHPKKVDRKTSESVYKTRPNNFIGEQK